MSDQLALWATGPLARRTDPPTCHQAPSQKILTELQLRVLAVHQANRDGLTDDQLCRNRAVCDVKPGSLIKRRGELTTAGKIENSGRRGPVEGSDRTAIIWQITDG